MESANTADKSRRIHALVDIAIVIAASAVAHLIELTAADRLPWGEEARGVVAVLVGALTALWLTRYRGRSLSDLGFRRPKRWSTMPLWAVGIFAVFVGAQVLAPAIVAPFFDLPAPDLSRYDYVRGNLGAALTLVLLLPLTASIPEEIIYRGFLIERLTSLVGSGRARAVVAVLIQALIFGSVHYQWGFGGIIVATVMGAVWGFAFLLCGRNLWIVIIAHSMGHVALVTQLYLSPPA